MTAENYIRRIRNPRKQTYARAYWIWLTGPQTTKEPDCGDLSYMAAQGVRMSLAQFVDGPDEGELGDRLSARV